MQQPGTWVQACKARCAGDTETSKACSDMKRTYSGCHAFCWLCVHGNSIAHEFFGGIDFLTCTSRWIICSASSCQNGVDDTIAFLYLITRSGEPRGAVKEKRGNPETLGRYGAWHTITKPMDSRPLEGLPSRCALLLHLVRKEKCYHVGAAATRSVPTHDSVLPWQQFRCPTLKNKCAHRQTMHQKRTHDSVLSWQ